jgi:hypothetical protein
MTTNHRYADNIFEGKQPWLSNEDREFARTHFKDWIAAGMPDDPLFTGPTLNPGEYATQAKLDEVYRSLLDVAELLKDALAQMDFPLATDRAGQLSGLSAEANRLRCLIETPLAGQ